MECATTTQQVLWTAYEILAPALAAALTWAAAWLTGVIRARIKNQVAAGMVERLTESVAAAVAAVNQRTNELLGVARQPDSQCGRRLSTQESALLKKAAMAYVKDFWGPKGLRELARILTPGQRDVDRQMAQMDRVISARIEAAVGATKRRPASSIVTQTPGK